MCCRVAKFFTFSHQLILDCYGLSIGSTKNEVIWLVTEFFYLSRLVNYSLTYLCKCGFVCSYISLNIIGIRQEKSRHRRYLQPWVFIYLLNNLVIYKLFTNDFVSFIFIYIYDFKDNLIIKYRTMKCPVFLFNYDFSIDSSFLLFTFCRCGLFWENITLLTRPTYWSMS